MPIVIPAEGAILECVLDTAHSNSPDGLSRQAYAKFCAAQMKTRGVAIISDDLRSWRVMTDASWRADDADPWR